MSEVEKKFIKYVVCNAALLSIFLSDATGGIERFCQTIANYAMSL